MLADGIRLKEWIPTLTDDGCGRNVEIQVLGEGYRLAGMDVGHDPGTSKRTKDVVRGASAAEALSRRPNRCSGSIPVVQEKRETFAQQDILRRVGIYGRDVIQQWDRETKAMLLYRDAGG